MQYPPAGTNPATDAELLAPFLADDGVHVHQLKVGEAAQRKRERLTPAEAAALDRLDALPGGRLYIARAAIAYHEHVPHLVREAGGVLIRERTRWVNGEKRTVRTVRRYVGTVRAKSPTATRTRSREHRAAPSRRRAGASSSTSSSDPGSGSSDSDPAGPSTGLKPVGPAIRRHLASGVAAWTA